MKLCAMLRAFVVALIAFVLTADCASAQAVNYNASKSNSGNVTGTKMNNKTGAGKGQPGMAIKSSGVPKNSSINKTTTRSNTQHN